MMTSVTQAMECYQTILEEEVPLLARETGAVKRVRKNGIDIRTLVQTLIFGFWQEPEARLSDLSQIATRREVSVTPSALCQRFTPECAELMQRVLERVTAVSLQSEPVDVPLLKQFSGVFVEDSSSILLPNELAEDWHGCGGSEGTSGAMVKLFVLWDVLTGALQGPQLTDGRTNDHLSPFAKEELPDGSLYLADLGFFGIAHLARLARQGCRKRFFVTRLQPKTTLYTRGGHHLNLEGVLPQQVGQVRELGVLLGKQERLAVRLIMVKVPEEVANERQERIRKAAEKHGRTPSAQVLAMAHWTIVLTNVPRRKADFRQVLALLRLRWQIERLFRLWKEDGKIDECRSKKPDRILCELYAKLCAMVMQQAIIQEGCWLDPHRSLVKAAASVRRECNRLMVAFYEGRVQQTITSIVRAVRTACRQERRVAHPSTAQLLLDGLDWQLELLLT